MTPARPAEGRPSRADRRLVLSRRGNYSLLLAVALVAVLGFAALTIDIGYVLLAQAQAQGVADAASQAALIMLRQTGDQNEARNAAAEIVSVNGVAGHSPTLDSVQFGAWDDSLANPQFQLGAARPNAVRVTVSRQGGNAIGYLFAKLFGYTTFGVQRTATSATRSLQFAIVLDVTGSWGERDFRNARTAVLTAFDMIAQSASDVDEVGMSIFTNRYAWEYTSFTNVAVPANAAAVRANWSLLNLASKAGRDTNHTDGNDCVLNNAANANNFNNPVGGCYPAMPREYTDESGTDHSTGMLLAKRMFENASGGANYRAMIVLTDGRPNTLGATSGTIRRSQGYVEARWPEYLGPVPRSIPEVRTASVAASNSLWNDYKVNTWVVSLIEDDPMMPQMAHGDGYYVRTNSSTELARIFAQIVSEIPLAIVQ